MSDRECRRGLMFPELLVGVPCPQAEQAGIPSGATMNTDCYYAYVIKSVQWDFYYKGHCKDLQVRLNEHNGGHTRSIKHYIPFEIIYFERFDTREEAIRRERYFKTAAGRKYLKNKMAM